MLKRRYAVLMLYTGFALFLCTITRASAQAPPAAGPPSIQLPAISGFDPTPLKCPWIPDENHRIKVTCAFGNYNFAHDGSGVHDADVSGARVQFVLDPARNGDVVTIIQGAGQGVDYRLTIAWMELNYTDQAGIRRTLVPRTTPSPSVFECRTGGHEFSWSGTVRRDWVNDALHRGQMTLSIMPSLRSGIPGAGC